MCCRDLDKDDESKPQTELERTLHEILDRNGGVAVKHLPKLLGQMEKADDVRIKLILLQVRILPNAFPE